MKSDGEKEIASPMDYSSAGYAAGCFLLMCSRDTRDGEMCNQRGKKKKQD